MFINVNDVFYAYFDNKTDFEAFNIIDEVYRLPGVTSVDYEDMVLMGVRPYEDWSIENTEIINFTSDVSDIYELGKTATVKGIKEGTAVVSVARAGYSMIRTYGTCEITVVKAGNVNGDGRVTSKDALWVLHDVAGAKEPTVEQFVAADIDEDGEISALDALKIISIAAGNEG